MISIISADNWRRMPWKNGLGVTSEIAVDSDGSSPFLWRLSIADVSESGLFSAYPGVQRWITVLDGAGMRLTVGADPSRVIHQLDPSHCFDGGTKTRCDLLNGPIQDVNLMLDHHVTGRMDVLSGPISQQTNTKVTLLHAVTAGVTVVPPGGAAVTLMPTDTAVVRAAACRVALMADATAIMARIHHICDPCATVTGRTTR